MKQRDANQVDLWLTNSFLLPLTVLNVSLSPRVQGAMKVRNKVTHNTSDHTDQSGLRIQLLKVQCLVLIRGF